MSDSTDGDADLEGGGVTGDAERQRPSDNTPIFVVGFPRSGTTLLYHLLIGSDVFPVYMSESKVMPCAEHYGPRWRSSRERFLDDFLQSRQFARSGLAASEFREKASRTVVDYPDFLRLFMDEVARAQGKPRWVEKTPAHLRHLDVLARRFESGRFVHIVRDGRDVAVSLRRLGWTRGFRGNRLFQLVEAAKRWESSVMRGRREGRRLGERYLEIRYEDLVTEPEGTMQRVAAFVGIEPSLRRPDSDHGDSLQSANTAFSAEMEGISDAGVGRWRKRLGEQEQRALAYTIGDSLERLGYGATGVEVSVSLGIRAFARVYPLVDGAQQLVKTRTPLGRVATASPLELGLE